MPYSSEMYEKAKNEIDKRRITANELNERRTEEIRQRFPKIYEAEMNVRSSFFSLLKQYIGGKVEDKAMLEGVEEQRQRSLAFVRQSLKENGYPEDYLDIPFFCPKCKDTGYVEGYACDCLKQLLKLYAAQDLKAGCTIKLHTFAEFREDVFENAQVAQHMCKLKNYLTRYCADFGTSQERRSMLFYGVTGTGKTFLSSCVASALLEQGFAVCFGTAYEYSKAIEDQHFRNAPGNTESELLDCDLLIIDDLGAEFRTSFTESVLYNIINTRINRSLPTIVSMNMTIDELKNRYNERISSRLTGVFTSIGFQGGDVRLNLQKKRMG